MSIINNKTRLQYFHGVELFYVTLLLLDITTRHYRIHTFVDWDLLDPEANKDSFSSSSGAKRQQQFPIYRNLWPELFIKSHN